MRPWWRTGRDSWACRLVGRSLPHRSTLHQTGRQLSRSSESRKFVAVFLNDRIRPAPKARIQSREHEQRQECRRDQSTYDHCGEWFLNFRAGSGREGHRDETERSDQRRHDHRPQTREGALVDRLLLRGALSNQLLDGRRLRMSRGIRARSRRSGLSRAEIGATAMMKFAAPRRYATSRCWPRTRTPMCARSRAGRSISSILSRAEASPPQRRLNQSRCGVGKGCSFSNALARRSTVASPNCGPTI
jgi:hypothetical protein